jgi:vancomycin permeability regulator SanA
VKYESIIDLTGSWTKIKTARKKNLFRFLFVSIALIVPGDIVASILYCNRIDNYLEKRQEPLDHDAGVVFFNDFGEYSGLSVETSRRLQHAFKLFRNGAVKNIVCVGGAREKKNLYGSKRMRKALMLMGVPESKIFYDISSCDSTTNWQEAHRIILENNFKSVVIISSPLHVYRLANIVRGKGLKISLSPYNEKNNKGFHQFFPIWKYVHYEWIASLTKKILPGGIYNQVIYMWRNSKLGFVTCRLFNQ